MKKSLILVLLALALVLTFVACTPPDNGDPKDTDTEETAASDNGEPTGETTGETTGSDNTTDETEENEANTKYEFASDDETRFGDLRPMQPGN